MNLGFDLLHDLGKDLCFVGDTYHNEMLFSYFNPRRTSVHLRLEEVLEKSNTWIEQHQFMCSVSNIGFKKLVYDKVTAIGGNFFSAVSTSSMIGHNVHIGKNTLVNHFNTIYDDTYIGNNCTLTNFITVSHEVKINDFCHIGPYTYFCFCKVNEGCFVGIRSSVFGYPENKIDMPAYTNLLADSRLMDSLEHNGTYSGRRLTDTRNSMEFHL